MNKGVLGTVFYLFSKLLGTIKIDFKYDQPKFVIFYSPRNFYSSALRHFDSIYDWIFAIMLDQDTSMESNSRAIWRCFQNVCKVFTFSKSLSECY